MNHPLRIPHGGWCGFGDSGPITPSLINANAPKNVSSVVIRRSINGWRKYSVEPTQLRKIMKNSVSKIVTAVITSITVITLIAAGKVGAQEGGCVKDAIGQITCSPPGGGIQKDAMGQIVCGRGQCIRDAMGQTICSSQAGGYARKDVMGQVVCTGGCEPASSSICQRPQ